MKKILVLFVILFGGIISFSMNNVYAGYGDLGDYEVSLDDNTQADVANSAGDVTDTDVSNQFGIIKMLGSPFGWGLFYDISKITYFLVPSYRSDVYKILGGTSETDKNVTTQLLGGKDGKYSMNYIDQKMGIKAFTIVMALILLLIFFYTLWNTKMGETVPSSTRSTRTTHTQHSDINNPSSPTTTQSSTKQTGGDDSNITFGDILVKLSEIAKLQNQDPQLAKTANILRMVIASILVLVITVITISLDTAMQYLSNLKPIYYIILGSIIIAIFYFLIQIYIRTGFSKLTKFITNTEEFSTDNIITEVFVKAIWVALLVIVASGGIQMFALLLSVS